MNGREYLGEIKRLDLFIEQRKKELEELKEIALGVSAVDFKRERVSKSIKNSYKPIDRYIDAEKEIQRLIDELISTKHKIIGEIQRLKNPLYLDVIFKRYVEYKSLDDIANEMNYNYSYIRRVHGEALSCFEREILAG